jgi:glyoxylase-like metal-dependent hydrolase (beta-lactamase superfamily II)
MSQQFSQDQQDQMVDRVRRDLMKRFFGIAAGAAVLPLASTATWAMPKRGAKVPDVKPVKLTDHIWVLYARGAWPTPENQGFFANIYLVDTPKGIVVLDTGTSVQIGEMAIRMIKQHFNKPIIAAFNSHYHGDHWLGNHAFIEANPSLPIYAHPDAITAITNAVGDDWLNQMHKATNGAVDGTKVTAPNTGVKNGQTFQYGDVTLKVHSYGPAHSPVDIMVEVVEDKALYVGDIIMDHRIGNPSETSFQGYIKTLGVIRDGMSDRLLMPGHGKPGHEKLLKNYEDIMHGIYDNAAKAVEEGMTIAEAKQMVLADPRVSQFKDNTEGFDEIGKFVSFAYTEAEQSLF